VGSDGEGNRRRDARELEQPVWISSCSTLAFGPVMPGWGSWQWAGDDVCEELSQHFRTERFEGGRIPQADVVVFVKFVPSRDLVEAIARRSKVIYAPVDYYGSLAEIDDDAAILRRCSRILVHCETLRKYFEPYAPVEYIDHHVRFAAPVRERFLPDGFILWVGVRTNLPPLVDWVNSHPLPCPLRVLTNPEKSGCIPTPAEFGFSQTVAVQIEEWTPERQLELTGSARAAIDIKGRDFRSRHKSPAKAIDWPGEPENDYEHLRCVNSDGQIIPGFKPFTPEEERRPIEDGGKPIGSLPRCRDLYPWGGAGTK
jgi:hypothetical protein